jgi:hypothetical protein
VGTLKWRVEVTDCATETEPRLIPRWCVAGREGKRARDIREREGTGNGGRWDATRQINVRVSRRNTERRGEAHLQLRRDNTPTVALDGQERDA